MIAGVTSRALVAASALGLLVAGLRCANPRASGQADRPENDPATCAAIPEEERRSSPLEAPNEIETVAPVHRYQWIAIAVGALSVNQRASPECIARGHARSPARIRSALVGRRGQRRPVPGSGRMTEVLVTLHTPVWTTLDAMDVCLRCHIAWMRSTGDELRRCARSRSPFRGSPRRCVWDMASASLSRSRPRTNVP